MKKLNLSIRNRKLIIEDANVVSDLRKAGQEIVGAVATTFLTLVEDIINISIYAISAIVTIFASQRIKDRIKNRYRRSYQQINSDYNAQIKKFEIEESNLINFLIQPGMFVSNKIAETLNEKLTSRGFDDLLDGFESLITSPFSTLGEITGLSRLGNINFSKIKQELELSLINSRESKDLGVFFDMHPIGKEKDSFLRSLRRRNLSRSAKFFEDLFKDSKKNENKILLQINNQQILIKEDTNNNLEKLKDLLIKVLSSSIQDELTKVSVKENQALIQENFKIFKEENKTFSNELRLVLQFLFLIKELIDNDIDKEKSLKIIDSLSKNIANLKDADKLKDFLNKVKKLINENTEEKIDTSKIKTNIRKLLEINYDSLVKEREDINNLYKKSNLSDEEGINNLAQINNNINELIEELKK